MTVCIAALYGHGQGVVMASDRMVTAHIPIGYEFEHEENTKIMRLLDTSSIRVLLSLIEDSYSLSMTKEQVVELVRKAKSRSEVAPGVGSQTTLVAIPAEGDGDA